MRATIVNSGFKEERWVRMMTLSFCFHLAVFSTILFIPQTATRYPSIGETVYHVELVGTPSVLKSGGKGGGITSTAKTKETSHMRDARTRRIALKPKKPLPVLAKRISPKPKAAPREQTYSPSELIDKAISKIERKVDKTTVQTEKTQDKLEEHSEALFEGGKRGGMPGISSDIGTTMKLYQMEIENTIKNNWSYPVALLNSKKAKIPEAVVIVTVKSDGKILKTWFKRRSHNALFDDSVLKAIEKSDPLPGFPRGYRKSYDEVEINFSLKDLV